MTFSLLGQVETDGLTTAGLTMMVACLALVIALCVFCFWKILAEAEPAERHHAPLDIDTRDVDAE